MTPVCPVHGGARLDFIPAFEANGMRDPPMLVCGACLDDGATPGGAWCWELPDGNLEAKE